jgi:hypothetical protein
MKEPDGQEGNVLDECEVSLDVYYVAHGLFTDQTSTSIWRALYGALPAVPPRNRAMSTVSWSNTLPIHAFSRMLPSGQTTV